MLVILKKTKIIIAYNGRIDKTVTPGISTINGLHLYCSTNLNKALIDFTYEDIQKKWSNWKGTTSFIVKTNDETLLANKQLKDLRGYKYYKNETFEVKTDYVVEDGSGTQSTFFATEVVKQESIDNIFSTIIDEPAIELVASQPSEILVDKTNGILEVKGEITANNSEIISISILDDENADITTKYVISEKPDEFNVVSYDVWTESYIASTGPSLEML